MDTVDNKQSIPILDIVMKPECLLSSKELFRYRKMKNQAPPQKGGAKDYAPDGSWLEKKKLETFHQERKFILSEQRVEMLSNLVVADWDMERHLVAFQKEIGKFWTHMGFIDHNRKWLYPEEALYLMETSTLVVMFKGLPLSIQQAYSAFLSGSVSFEEYQVYAHLRRYGYVVLRHQGKIDITKYERQIGLDQYIDQKQRKRKKAQSTTQPSSDGDSDDCSCKRRKKDCVKCKSSLTETMGMYTEAKTNLDREYEKTEVIESMNRVTDYFNIATGDVREYDEESGKNNLEIGARSAFKTNSEIKSENGNKNDFSSETVFYFPHSEWNFNEIIFPDIGNVEFLRLSKASKQCLPSHVETSNDFFFDVQEYKSKRKNRKKDKDTSIDISNLKFSHSEIMEQCSKTRARNWSEFKQMLEQGCGSEHTDPKSPVQHLWEGEVTPLVRPTDAVSTANILEKLQVIENISLSKQSSSQLNVSEPVKISFDVYLPDHRFKKSCPGIPNQRVCVLKSCDDVPGLGSIMNSQLKLEDNVPLTCAVVDCGEIVFYTFSDVTLPVDITKG